jgi:hypothetical protein
MIQLEYATGFNLQRTIINRKCTNFLEMRVNYKFHKVPLLKIMV